MQNRLRSHFFVRIVPCVLTVLSLSLQSYAQMSFQSAVSLALVNSPQLKVAQNDVKKADAGLSVVKDIFIPSVVTSGGAGATTGITLTVPTIFTISAQSLLFSFQQRSYIHSAHADVQAARLALKEARNQVEEDAVVTYLALDEAQSAVDALTQQYGYAQELVSIVEDRAHAGLESDLEVIKARRAAVQIRLQELQAKDNVENLREHLAEITGMPSDQVVTLANSIPKMPPIPSDEDFDRRSYSDSPAILAAEANLKAKEERAKGDAEYTWRPIVTLGAQYGRVSPINGVSDFYNLHGNYNTANVGFQIEVPILDRVRKAAADESRADAQRARIDLDNLKIEQRENRLKLERSFPELAAKAELAELDFEIAQHELNSTTIASRGVHGPNPVSPKDEKTAQIQERQRYLDLLDAKLQAEKAEAIFLRQTGQLDGWVESLTGTTAVSPEIINQVPSH